MRHLIFSQHNCASFSISVKNAVLRIANSLFSGLKSKWQTGSQSVMGIVAVFLSSSYLGSWPWANTQRPSTKQLKNCHSVASKKGFALFKGVVVRTYSISFRPCTHMSLRLLISLCRSPRSQYSINKCLTCGLPLGSLSSGLWIGCLRSFKMWGDRAWLTAQCEAASLSRLPLRAFLTATYL